MCAIGEANSPSTAGAGPADVIACWSCRGPVATLDLFCPTCEAVQPPGQRDSFARLGVGVSFEVDVEALDQRYFELQRLLHPDRFATKSAKERALSQQQATSLNEAYETLKDPLKRADHMIHLLGIEVLREGCNQLNDPVILMEAMELREQLAGAESAETVEKIAATTADDIEDCEAGLALAFRGRDLDGACSLTTRLKYLRKLVDEVRAARARIGGG